MGYALCVYIRWACPGAFILALLPRCCSIAVSRSSKPAAFPAFNKLRPVASSSRLKGLVSSVGGWLLLGTIVLWCSPGESEMTDPRSPWWTCDIITGLFFIITLDWHHNVLWWHNGVLSCSGEKSFNTFLSRDLDHDPDQCRGSPSHGYHV